MVNNGNEHSLPFEDLLFKHKYNRRYIYQVSLRIEYRLTKYP